MPSDPIPTREALEEILERAGKATVGPWETDAGCVIRRCERHERWTYEHVEGEFYGIIADTGEHDDCQSLDFIAASREDVPLLAKALLAAREVLESVAKGTHRCFVGPLGGTCECTQCRARALLSPEPTPDAPPRDET